ncbi:hypothetical protein [Leptospira kmetyi]|uniref:hypothetical protein n=1 Tax=Leptospira kmetyi TaxID=408139 RepID=UPI003EBE3B5B
MKMNIVKFAAVTALILAFAACKKDNKDDNTATAALLYLLDQTSGNCAVVQRTNATLYTAQLNVIPKGGCNQATLSGSTLAESTLITQGYYDSATTLATSLGCNSTTLSNLATAKNNVATVNATAAAQTAFDTNAEKTRYYAISDLRVEAIAPLNAALGPLGFSQAEILALNRLDVNLFKNINSIGFITTAAVAASDTACQTALTNKTKTDFAGVMFLDATANTKAKLTSIALTACTYGSSSVAANTCASLNTQF